MNSGNINKITQQFKLKRMQFWNNIYKMVMNQSFMFCKCVAIFKLVTRI